MVGHSRDTLGLGTPKTLQGEALRKHWVWARLWGWGHFGVGHARDERGVDRASRRVPGERRVELKSNNPTPRVGKNAHLHILTAH